MSTKTIPLVERTSLETRKPLSAKDFGAEGGWSVHSFRLQEGLRDGVHTVEVTNGDLIFVIVPTRGMGLSWANLPGLRVGWTSPVRGPVHPAFVDLGEPSGLGWLDGFDELLVRCGLESNGAPEFDEATGRLKYPLHGRIANKPAYDVTASFDPESQEIAVRGVVEECRFHFLKLRMTSTISTKVGSTAIHVHDEIENLSAGPAEMQMLYHVNFGPPLLEAGSRLVGPFKTVVPRNERAAGGVKSWDSFEAPQPGFEEQVYFTDLLASAKGETRVLLKTAHGTQGVSLVYNAEQLPCFSLWKNTTAEQDGCVTGLEPGTNYPNPRSFEGEQRRVVKLAPGGKTTFELTLEIHATAKEVAAAESSALAIAGGKKPKIFEEPQSGWCAGVE